MILRPRKTKTRGPSAGKSQPTHPTPPSPRLCIIYLRDVASFRQRKEGIEPLRRVSHHASTAIRSILPSHLPRHHFDRLQLFVRRDTKDLQLKGSFFRGGQTGGVCADELCEQMKVGFALSECFT
jgi:hypothetical protein